jgi:hypothetical protein
MFYPESRSHIWLCTEPTDIRTSFTGLSGLIKLLIYSETKYTRIKVSIK